MDNRGRNVASYVLFALGVLCLGGAAVAALGLSPLAPVGLALAVMFIGGGWLAMAPQPGADSGRPMRLFLGRLVLSAGVLIVALCGVCTLAGWAILIPGVVNDAQNRHGLARSIGGAFALPFLFGGVPIVIGVLIAVFGRSLIRSYKAKAEG
ncbi:MAG TPA: hypothetical protein VGL66_04935 [Caulobacteraceae bacterium]|jgi:hypothetical protein